MIEEPPVPRDASASVVLRRTEEEGERPSDSRGALRTGYDSVLDGDRHDGEFESDSGDARRRAGGPPIGRKPRLRRGRFQEPPDRPLLERVEKRIPARGALLRPGRERDKGEEQKKRLHEITGGGPWIACR